MSENYWNTFQIREGIFICQITIYPKYFIRDDLYTNLTKAILDINHLPSVLHDIIFKIPIYKICPKLKKKHNYGLLYCFGFVTLAKCLTPFTLTKNNSKWEFFSWGRRCHVFCNILKQTLHNCMPILYIVNIFDGLQL